MGIGNFFRRQARDSNEARFKSKKDMLLYIKNNTGLDDDVAGLIVNALEHAGRDCYIEIKKGGTGNPYYLEYQDLNNRNGLSNKDIKMRIKLLKEIEAQASAGSEEEYLQKKIAETAGALVTVWINTESDKDFESKSGLIKEAWLKIKESQALT
ncbi:MAG: hypothetical protein WC695_09150 [Candidatus Omnitrophota bacterium]